MKSNLIYLLSRWIKHHVVSLWVSEQSVENKLPKCSFFLECENKQNKSKAFIWREYLTCYNIFLLSDLNDSNSEHHSRWTHPQTDWHQPKNNLHILTPSSTPQMFAYSFLPCLRVWTENTVKVPISTPRSLSHLPSLAAPTLLGPFTVHRFSGTYNTSDFCFSRCFLIFFAFFTVAIIFPVLWNMVSRALMMCTIFS